MLWCLWMMLSVHSHLDKILGNYLFPDIAWKSIKWWNLGWAGDRWSSKVPHRLPKPQSVSLTCLPHGDSVSLTSRLQGSACSYHLPFSWLIFGEKHTHSHSVLGGMHRFTVLRSAFLILCFMCCIQGLDKVFRAAEAFPPFQGSWEHHGMSLAALCAPAQTQGIANPNHIRNRKGWADSTQDPLLSKTRRKTRCRAVSKHLASVCLDQIQITSSCIWAMAGKGPSAAVPPLSLLS